MPCHIKFLRTRCLLGLLIASFLLVIRLPLQAQSYSKQLEEVERIFTTISANNSYVADLNFHEGENIHLPLGVKRTIGGIEVTVAISHLELAEEHTELGVYAKAVIPQGQDGRRSILFFGAEGVKGTHTGGLAGELKLSLLHDVGISFNNGNTKIVLKGGELGKDNGAPTSQTYMTADCDGFKSLSLDAEVHFPTSLLVKVGAQDESSPSSNAVIGHFSTVVNHWDDLLVSMTLPNFEINGLKDYIFSVENVVLDFSSLRNSEQIQFPAGYERYLTDDPSLWRGVYARNVSITLPRAFSQAHISAQNLIIDDQGISGLFAADNVLPLEKGSADGWPFSVDRFSMEFVANELTAANFKGRLGLPFQGEHTTLRYDGLLRPGGEYVMKVLTDTMMDFSIFNAKAQLDPNSYISLRLASNRFIPEAVLHGYMSLAGAGATLPKLTFRNLKLTSTEPYISAEYFGYEGDAKLGDFPLSIHKLGLSNSSSREVKLLVGAGINLSEGLFSGKADLAFLAHYDGRIWVFDDLQIGAIAVNSTIAGALRLQGKLDWHRNDAVYGNGFAGDVTLGISFGDKASSSTQPGVSIHARAAFGRKDNFRYWYADGMAIFRPGVPIVGAMTLNGFGGALTFGVRPEGRDPSGGHFTQARYIPDASQGLGFKASTVFEVAKAAHGEAAFEMGFTKTGGLAYMGFYGYGEFPNKGGAGTSVSQEQLAQRYAQNQEQRKNATLPDEPGISDFVKLAQSTTSIPNSIKESGLSGTIGIQMDFQNKSLHASTRLYINTPGGFIRGAEGGGEAGWGILHIAPNEWYLHLGTPSRRLGVQLNVGNIIAIRSGSYFMAGSHIPEMPAPPREVADILGTELSTLKQGRNLEALSTGKGLAFGSELSVKTGDLQYLIMYANFHTGLGFDVMLKDYGQAQCKGRSGPIGMNGWYAMGQTYAYLQGELGVKVKLWLVKMRVPVIKGGAAALLQAGLPNPTYFKGYLGVNLNVLGLIKGKARFKLSIGEECEIIRPGSSPIEEPIINDLSPSTNENEVSVFTIPQATFNMELGKHFSVTNDAGEKKIYRIGLQHFELKDKGGKSIPGKIILGNDKREARFQAKEILPPHSELTAHVLVSFEELQNGHWRQVVTSGKPAIEERTHTFITGGAPNNIPLENIVYSYPVVDQKYFLTEESSKGYVQLLFGQKYLFEKGFNYRLNFSADDGSRIGTEFKYNDADNRIEFTIPKLLRKTPYIVDLSYTASADSQQPQGAKPKGASKEMATEDFTGQIGGDKAQASISASLEQSILNYSFATSLHPTFRDKMGQAKMRDPVAFDAGITFTLGAIMQAREGFDDVEIQGTDRTQQKALLLLKAGLEEDYFSQTVYPLVYDGYPHGPVRLRYRDESPLGIPPHYGFSLTADYLNALNSKTVNPNHFYFPFTFIAPLVVFQDYRDLEYSVINNRNAVGSAVYNRFATRSLPVLKDGKYKVAISYRLPDGTITSTVDFFFKNVLGLNK